MRIINNKIIAQDIKRSRATEIKIYTPEEIALIDKEFKIGKSNIVVMCFLGAIGLTGGMILASYLIQYFL